LLYIIVKAHVKRKAIPSPVERVRERYCEERGLIPAAKGIQLKVVCSI
jgi:hypothetical protein